MHQGEEDTSTVFGISGTAIHLLGESKRHALAWRLDFCAFSSVNTGKDTQRSSNSMAAGFAKAEVWKVPQHPSMEAGGLRTSSTAEH